MKKFKKVIIQTKAIAIRLYLFLLSTFTGRKYYFQVQPLGCFLIRGEFGQAGFMKRFNHKAICLHSSESTYERNREYYIQNNQIVIKTSK